MSKRERAEHGGIRARSVFPGKVVTVGLNHAPGQRECWCVSVTMSDGTQRSASGDDLDEVLARLLAIVHVDDLATAP